MATINERHTEPDGALRVQLQDPNTEIFDAFLVQELGMSKLAAPAVVNTRTITLEVGHGFVVGNVIYINGLYKARVLSVATNVLTVNQPLNQSFPADTLVYRMSSAMNVNGSVTPKIFRVAPPPGYSFDLYSLRLNLRSTADMDDSKFGGIPALTNGLMFRVKKSNEAYNNLFSVRINSEFQLRCEEVVYETKAPAGEYGLTTEYSFIKKGVAVRLNGNIGQALEVIVFDDLSVSGITFLSCVTRGHIVS